MGRVETDQNICTTAKHLNLFGLKNELQNKNGKIFRFANKKF